MLRVELDFPAAELFPNRSKGRHWGSLHKHKSAAREAAYWQTLASKPMPSPSDAELLLTITFEMPDKRHRDTDNCLAAAKSALDGVASAMSVDDKRFNPIKIYRKHGKPPGKMIVQIEASR